MITVRAAAKINLRLHVGPLRADGFHPLDTVYQAIGLYDDLTATPAQEWSVHTVADAHVDLTTVPEDADNIAVKAGLALLAHHETERRSHEQRSVPRAAHLEIYKGIPVAGGLAGGSADAAAALVALDRLWDLQTSDADLLAIAAGLGSDVPFALLGGTAHGGGRGEEVTEIEGESAWWVVVPHAVGLSTPVVYQWHDAMVARGELVPGAQENDLQPAAYALCPDLAERHVLLERFGPVLLSGSGPTQLIRHDDPVAARLTGAELSELGIGHVLAPAPVAGATVISHG